jgi:hypothetical protein
MSKLKLHAIEDDKPVRLTIDLPATVHRDLAVYAVGRFVAFIRDEARSRRLL